MNIAETLSTTNYESQVLLLNEELRKRDEKINDLEEQLNWLKRQIFGKRSERVVSSINEEQLLFEGFENLPHPEEKKRHITHSCT